MSALIYLSTLRTGLSVPSPLAGEGQGEGCHTTGSVIFEREDNARPRLQARLPKHASRPGPPLSPTLPRKGGGSAPVVRQYVGSNDNHRGGAA
ncbi:hypothetical protein FBZ93_110286 [Bradyrhizobium macuxiense]|uniref:Uncharacterized protein n=1 Tax=Bradyrhizobium macuxiense TaxID=1755647 RepID=A0A560LK57_9BRAD|nr:hypothetical protein FBZ93_110286 [Bradyrhizobium macuxiense]